MEKTNYHSHCSWCDGRADFELFVQEAVRQGFTSYGVSSHAPLPFSTKWTLDKANVVHYLNDFSRVKAAYKDRIELYVGMEIDYLDANSNPSSAYFQNLPLDYRIGSVHLLTGTAGEVVDIDTPSEVFRENLQTCLGKNIRRVVEAYFEKAMTMIEAGGFDFLGHPDKIYNNALSCCPDLLETNWYNSLQNDYYTLISEKGLPIEINTKVYESRKLFFPHIKYWKQILHKRIPVLVNSDAHFPERIDSGREAALNLMKECGFTELLQLKKGKWTEMPLNESS